jgi:hypothetical protein
MQERFQREARTIAELSYANISTLCRRPSSIYPKLQQCGVTVSESSGEKVRDHREHFVTFGKFLAPVRRSEARL